MRALFHFFEVEEGEGGPATSPIHRAPHQRKQLPRFHILLPDLDQGHFRLDGFPDESRKFSRRKLLPVSDVAERETFRQIHGRSTFL